MTTTLLNTSDPDQVYGYYLQAIERGAFAQASEVVQSALQGGVVPEAIYDQVFTPTLREVGRRWQTGEMTVAQEHLATGITEYCRSIVLNDQKAANHLTSRKVMLTSVNGNQHTLGLNLLADIFRWRGWEVFPLFSALPDDEIASAVQFYHVDLVCLSVALPAQITRVTSAIKTLRQSGWTGLIEVGGAAFVNYPEITLQTGADFYGGDALETVEKVTQLMKSRK